MKKIIKIISIQFLLFFILILIDLYVFRGYYTSEIIINPNMWVDNQDYDCNLKIEKDNKNYIFRLTNKSICPKYFTNYRNDELFQKLGDTLPLLYLEKNLGDLYSEGYYPHFDCGTGLGLTSINPFDSFEIRKTYNDIINENSHNLIKTIELNKPIKSFSKKQIDSIINNEFKSISEKDSIDVEYYLPMISFVSKNSLYVVSNKINLSKKDLFIRYMKRNSTNH